MGVYATTTSISELVPRFLIGNTTTSDTAGTAIFSRHIDRAEGRVMAYASARYDVSGFRVGTTTTNVPPLLRSLAEDVASWYAVRGSHVQDGQLKQQYLAEYEDALRVLESIRDGKTALAYTDGSEVPVRSGMYGSSTEGWAPVFDMDGEGNWKVDPDQLTEIEGNRG